MDTVSVETRGRTAVVTIERPDRRNAVDGATAQALYAAFKAFDADDALDIAILQGRGGSFCAGADLKAKVGAIRCMARATSGRWDARGYRYPSR